MSRTEKSRTRETPGIVLHRLGVERGPNICDLLVLLFGIPERSKSLSSSNLDEDAIRAGKKYRLANPSSRISRPTATGPSAM